jgi:hypothetical protein
MVHFIKAGALAALVTQLASASIRGKIWEQSEMLERSLQMMQPLPPNSSCSETMDQALSTTTRSRVSTPDLMNYKPHFYV